MNRRGVPGGGGEGTLAILFTFFIVIALAARASSQGWNRPGGSNGGGHYTPHGSRGPNSNLGGSPAVNLGQERYPTTRTTTTTPSTTPPSTYVRFVELATDLDYFAGDSEEVTNDENLDRSNKGDPQVESAGGDKCPQGTNSGSLPGEDLDKKPDAVQFAEALGIACSAFRNYIKKETKKRAVGDLEIVDSCGIQYTIKVPKRPFLYVLTNRNHNSISANVQGKFQAGAEILQQKGSSIQTAATAAATTEEKEGKKIRAAAENSWQQFALRVDCLFNPGYQRCFRQN